MNQHQRKIIITTTTPNHLRLSSWMNGNWKVCISNPSSFTSKVQMHAFSSIRFIHMWFNQEESAGAAIDWPTHALSPHFFSTNLNLRILILVFSFSSRRILQNVSRMKINK